jgi:hypothetical protein
MADDTQPVDPPLKNTRPKLKKHMSRKKKALITLTLLGLLAGGAFYAAQQFMSGPAVGTVVSSMPALTRTPEVELVQFDGTHFSFARPITYIDQTPKPDPGTKILESRTFVASGMMSKILTATVVGLPSGKPEDDSSYFMRAQNPTKYQMRSIVVKNEKVTVFTSNDGQQYQQSGFWPHGGKLLTFTMTGVASDIPGMNSEYQSMLESVSWL